MLSGILISKLSEYSFGVYLLHALILDVLKVCGLTPTLVHPLLAMPLITSLTFAVTSIVIMLIRKIPNVGKKIT